MKRWSALITGLLVVASFPLSAQDTWDVLDTGMTQDLQAAHFLDEDVGYVAGAAGTVFKTTDGGQTWEDVSPDIAQDLHGLHFFTEELGVVVGGGGTIERTDDGGANWTPITSNTSETLFGVSFSDSVGLAVGSAETILRSEDQGESWEEVRGDFFSPGFFGVHMVDGSTGVTGGENSIFQPLFGYTSDGGMSFDFVSFYFDSNEGRIQDVHFLDPLRGFAVGRTFDFQGAVALSEDGGETWETTLFPEALRAVDFATEEVGYTVGAAGAMLKTIDGGETWEPEKSGTTVTLNAISIPTTSTGYVAGNGGTVLKGSIAMPSSVPDEGTSPRLALKQNHPNPFRSRTVVRYTLPESTETTVRVYNVLGQEVAVLADGHQARGRHEITFDASQLGAGVYLYALETETSIRTRRMIVLK